jgi:hypothetical protein
MDGVDCDYWLGERLTLFGVYRRRWNSPGLTLFPTTIPMVLRTE